MKLTIDTDRMVVSKEIDNRFVSIPLFSKEAFEIISDLWIKLGWDQKYVYTFSWMGRPVIQLPEDLIRIQEIIYNLKPDVILETGIAHGGSLIYYASLCKAMDRGRVIGVDIEIRKHNRDAIENHELFPLIQLIEGSSIDQKIVNEVKNLIKPEELVLIILDSCHTKEHVLAEIEAYYELVKPGSYIIATDGIMKDVFNSPRGTLSWEWDNPTEAAKDFVKTHPEFLVVQPKPIFNESELDQTLTHWPGAWIQRANV